MMKNKGTKKGRQGKETFIRLNYLYQAAHLVLTQAPHNVELARFYCSTFKSVATKNVLRIDPTVKRTICKKCCLLLIPGVTATVRKGGGKKQSWMIVKCVDCGSIKRFPTNEQYKLWSQQPYAWIGSCPLPTERDNPHQDLPHTSGLSIDQRNQVLSDGTQDNPTGISTVATDNPVQAHVKPAVINTNNPIQSSTSATITRTKVGQFEAEPTVIQSDNPVHCQVTSTAISTHNHADNPASSNVTTHNIPFVTSSNKLSVNVTDNLAVTVTNNQIEASVELPVTRNLPIPLLDSTVISACSTAQDEHGNVDPDRNSLTLTEHSQRNCDSQVCCTWRPLKNGQQQDLTLTSSTATNHLSNGTDCHSATNSLNNDTGNLLRN